MPASARKCCRSARSGLPCARICRLRVLSAFEDEPGTDIVAELSGEDMERNLIAGIAADRNEARITLTGVPDGPGTVAAVIGPLAEAGIPVDMIVHAATPDTGVERPHLHRPARQPRPGDGGDRAAQGRRSAIGELVTRRRGRQGQHRRRRHPLQPAARGEDVRDARRAADQPARGLDQRDQGQRADRRGRARPCGAGAPHRLRPRCGDRRHERRGPDRRAARGPRRRAATRASTS